MRDDGSGTFELDGATLLELDADDAISSQAIGFTADDAALYVITPAASNAAGLVKIAPGSSPETLADDPTYDVASAELNPVTRTVEIVSFLRARLEHQVLDPALAPRHRRDHGPSPGRRLPHLARPRRPHVDGRVHGRRRPGRLLRVRPGRAGRALPLHAARRPGPVPALADGAVRVRRPRRARDPRLPDVPAGRAAPGPPHRALRARRAVGARHLGLRPDRAVARQPRLPVRAGELPRVDRLRQGVPERGRPRVGPQDARRT